MYYLLVMFLWCVLVLFSVGFCCCVVFGLYVVLVVWYNCVGILWCIFCILCDFLVEEWVCVLDCCGCSCVEGGGMLLYVVCELVCFECFFLLLGYGVLFGLCDGGGFMFFELLLC